MLVHTYVTWAASYLRLPQRNIFTYMKRKRGQNTHKEHPVDFVGWLGALLRRCMWAVGWVSPAARWAAGGNGGVRWQTYCVVRCRTLTYGIPDGINDAMMMIAVYRLISTRFNSTRKKIVWSKISHATAHFLLFFASRNYQVCPTRSCFDVGRKKTNIAHHHPATNFTVEQLPSLLQLYCITENNIFVLYFYYYSFYYSNGCLNVRITDGMNEICCVLGFPQPIVRAGSPFRELLSFPMTV